MEFRPSPLSTPLTAAERKTVERLLDSALLVDVRPVLRSMLEAGSKGDYEQESLGAAGLHEVLAEVMGKQERGGGASHRTLCHRLPKPGWPGRMSGAGR